MWAHPSRHDTTHMTCTQVVADVASAIGRASELGVLHRDVTPNNVGHLKGRGYLFDYSAGQVRGHFAHRFPKGVGCRMY